MLRTHFCRKASLEEKKLRDPDVEVLLQVPSMSQGRSATLPEMLFRCGRTMLARRQHAAVPAPVLDPIAFADVHVIDGGADLGQLRGISICHLSAGKVDDLSQA